MFCGHVQAPILTGATAREIQDIKSAFEVMVVKNARVTACGTAVPAQRGIRPSSGQVLRMAAGLTKAHKRRVYSGRIPLNWEAGIVSLRT